MPDSGTLITRVFTSRGQLPLKDASVIVLLRQPGDRQMLLSIQVSDQNGNTHPVQVETPTEESSTEPSEEQAYSLCDILVSCEGYQPLMIQNVQMFPGIISVQDLPMIPISFQRPDTMMQVDITAQDL